jgi:hypothetical protein
MGTTMWIRRISCGVCLLAAFFVAPASAGQAGGDRYELDVLRREIGSLREEVDQLKQDRTQNGQGTMAVEPYQPARVAGEEAQYTELARRTTQSFNPDISAIGDVLFHAGENDEGVEKNQFQFRELELAFGAAVDPYGRADFFIGIEEEEGHWHVHLEEGYFTFDTLPHDLKARAGKFYSAFGKANQFHTHSMPWVDKPLVIRNYFGEEGMSEPGAELSWLAPNPWDQYIELIFEAQNNGNDLSFAGGESRELMYLAHLKNFIDLNSDSTLEVGGSFATGENAATGGENRTNLEGVDVTFKWRPAQQGLYRSLTWMNELLLSQKQQGAEDTVDSYGWYSSLEYQFARRWSVYGRYDYSQFPDDDDSHENAYSGGLTFAQSEYAFWRAQFTHTEGDGDSASGNRDEFFLQFDFGIGPHRAHEY